ncbi:hypothetical protein G8T75_16170, partial [Clostridium botulinum D/C]|nr:hypothetical protein [Clostridium botulinum D/C]
EQVKVDEKTDNKPVVKPDTKPVQKEETKQDTNKIDIQKLKQQIKTPEDLERFLNDDSRFNQLKTPVGTFRFTTKMDINHSKDDCSRAYDFDIMQDWDKSLSPIDVANCKNCTKQQARQTASLMKDYQKQVADLALSLFPNEKIEGGFLSTDKNEIAKLPMNRPDVLFYYWSNYNDEYSTLYMESNVTNFHFNSHTGSFWFDSYIYGLYKD